MARKKASSVSYKYQGLDLSPNHAGFVEINRRRDVVYSAALICDYEKSARAAAELGVDVTYFPAKKLRASLDQTAWKLTRLVIVNAWLVELLKRRAGMLAIEGYAWSKHTGAYEIAEIGGCARILAAHRGQPFRLINPLDVKKYAGVTRKEKPIEFCALELGVDWSEANGGIKAPETAGDLSDATVLANIALDCFEAEYDESLKVREPIRKILKTPALIGDELLWTQN